MQAGGFIAEKKGRLRHALSEDAAWPGDIPGLGGLLECGEEQGSV